MPRLAERHLRLRRPALPATDSSRSDNSCSSTTQPATIEKSLGGHEDLRHQRQDATRSTSPPSRPPAARTRTRWCPEGQGPKNVYIYVSSYAPSATFPDCQPPHDGISVIKVPRRHPRRRRSSTSRSSSPDGGNPGRATAVYPAASPRPPAATTSPCYPSKDLAAGACMGDGILFDIKDPANPKVIDRVQDNVNFAFWHSATFNQRGQQGRLHRRARRRRRGHLQRGDRPEPRRRRHLRHRQGRRAQARLPELLQDPAPPGRHRELRRPQRLADPGQGQGHHGPGLVPGRRLGLGLHRLRQAQGDRATSSAAPTAPTAPLSGGSWSAYYYNGYIYSNDIAKGFDVLKINDRRTDERQEGQVRRPQHADPGVLP